MVSGAHVVIMAGRWEGFVGTVLEAYCNSGGEEKVRVEFTDPVGIITYRLLYRPEDLVVVA